MKLIVIGAEGTVGSAACNELAARHEIIKVGRTSGDIQVDIEDRDSIDAMYRETGKVERLKLKDHGFTFKLPAGTGDLFKYAGGRPFVGVKQ